MSIVTFGLPPRVRDYLVDHSVRQTAVQKALARETAKLPMARMQSSPESAQFLGLLAASIGAKRIVEVGVFTGYATLAMAMAIPKNGKIVALDVSEDYTNIARKHWKKAGVDKKIDLRLAPALESLDKMLAKGMAGRFDMAFIDADKENYLGYYERVLKLLRTGGLMAVDNVLWGGSVADPKDTSASTRAIRAFNKKVKGDRRVDVSMVPIADGVTLARKR